MEGPIFIGDELSAAGYRLAGAQVRVPQRGEEASLIEWACSRTGLVLITAECAAAAPMSVLQRILSAPSPLVLIVPDVRARAAPPDLAARTRAQLGIQA